AGHIENPREFINPLPHISFVRGVNNKEFLKKRYEAMKQSPMFDNIEYTEDTEVMRKWIPLMMKGRVDDGKMAASKIDEGTDVNFGELTRKMSRHLELDEHVEVKYSHQVLDFERLSNGKWQVKIKDLKTGNVFEEVTDYVFIGAGGAAIPLLQKTGIP
ncbi:malate:quinone oxidoreductase, partial [Staphylococcus aureus]|nr:malate:quinone oxidoreductase [Staphylococcus aureus]